SPRLDGPVAPLALRPRLAPRAGAMGCTQARASEFGGRRPAEGRAEAEAAGGAEAEDAAVEPEQAVKGECRCPPRSWEPGRAAGASVASIGGRARWCADELVIAHRDGRVHRYGGGGEGPSAALVLGGGEHLLKITQRWGGAGVGSQILLITSQHRVFALEGRGRSCGDEKVEVIADGRQEIVALRLGEDGKLVEVMLRRLDGGGAVWVPPYRGPKGDAVQRMHCPVFRAEMELAFAMTRLKTALPAPQYWRAPQSLYWGPGGWELFAAPEFKQQAQEVITATWLPRKTRDRTGRLPSGLKVLSVDRLQNCLLWQRYQDRKTELLSRGPCVPVSELDGVAETGAVKTAVLAQGAELSAEVNEHYLFHGTSIAGANGITQHGFQIARAGEHVGTMFGAGCYFAECSSKADEYVHDTGLKSVANAFKRKGAADSAGAGGGTFALLLCRVLCGRLFRVTQKDPEGISAALADGYDSVLGDREASVGTYREFVSFNQENIYPEYKIIYERVYEEFG
ncbi:unnamed protein product, partial [Prorocentrum cordatum]